jgi:hypothetical protein
MKNCRQSDARKLVDVASRPLSVIGGELRCDLAIFLLQSSLHLM